MNEWYLLGFFAGLTLLACILMVYPLRSRFFASVGVIPLVFLSAFTGYYYWGSFGEWQHDAQSRATQKQAQNMLQSIKNPQELIKKLRAKLDDTPKSAKGWYLLGRIYSSLDERKKALTAFAKAYRFDPDNEQYAVNYAHSLWVKNNQQFSVQITEVFERVLKNNPNQPDALAMLAMDAFISQAYEDAIGYWQRLLKIAPAQSDEAQAIRKAIVKAEERIKLREKD